MQYFMHAQGANRMVLNASCHCGAVQMEIARKPRSMTECNCSICRRYGARWAYFTRKTARILCAPDAISAYAWGDRTVEFFHCRTCGCLTHYEATVKSDDSRIAVNARMMSPADAADIKVRIFDGAETWKYLD